MEGSVIERVSLYDQLMKKYPMYMNEQLTDVSLLQTEEAVYLETVEVCLTESGLEKKRVSKSNLEFIIHDAKEDDMELGESNTIELGGEPYFDPANDIEENALKFINDFDVFSIINTTCLFNEEAEEEISRM